VLDGVKLDCFLRQTADQLHGVFPEPAVPLQIHTYDVVTSTSMVVWQGLAAGAPEGTVAIAQSQQGGRGQRGRSWQSAPGGLYFSLGLTPNIASVEATGLTLCCAWGIATALRQWQIPVGLKWVNDLILDRYKLGGVLTETRIQQGRIHQAVVGVGLNWANPVPEPGIALYSWLRERQRSEIDSLELLAAIALQGAMGGYRCWQATGTTGILPHYERFLVNRGQEVMLDGQSAIVLGISTQGYLRVRYRESGIERHLEPGQISLGYPTPVL